MKKETVMKYIDADKLIAEIERRRLSNRYIDTEGYENELLEIITSLQQDKETLMLEMCNQSFWEDSGYIMIPPDVTIEGIESLLKQVKKKLQQEQPEVELDFQVFAKEMDVVFNLPKGITENTEENPLNWEYAIARHFYELGLNARKDR